VSPTPPPEQPPTETPVTVDPQSGEAQLNKTSAIRLGSDEPGTDEGKTFGADGRSAGLNLTRAALDATVKYPWPRREGLRKFGHYPDDVEVYAWLRGGARSGTRCLEAQVMDFADDVAYSVHDVEDGVQADMIELGALASPAERADLAALARKSFLPDLDAGELDEAAAELTALAWWPRSPDRTDRRSQLAATCARAH
jgi:dGTPase